ncbi:uncharacterized protein PG998_015011 [Apiospora kogelbergensis]|uniref:uncharacterized protein n=1 Tax=Apiospora kogelbergensis TaxID=1337665 RepID=UPI00312E72BE
MDGDALRLISQLWQPLGKQSLFNGEASSKIDHTAYAYYYSKQWQVMMVGHDSGGHYPVPTGIDDILDLACQIRDGKTRAEIIAQLCALRGGMAFTHQGAENFVNLTLRLLSMVNFGTARRQIMPRGCLVWDRDGSFAEHLADHFGKPPVLSCEQVRLPKSFHAWSIEKIGGIDICFTDNLADHILLVEDDSKLLLFHHVSFLEYQPDDATTFPTGLVNETLRTLALLLPEAQFGQRQLRRRRRRSLESQWFHQKRLREGSERALDVRLARCGNLQMEERQIEHFAYWRDRLVILKQAYDDATPRTVSQWWHDRRNGVQWCTFWVAVAVLFLTTFLGLVQCVESALQVYKAYVPS